jgi:uncharacterized protein (DUF1499 family)
VSSDAVQHCHRVEPFRPRSGGPEAWRAIVATVERLARTRVVVNTEGYLRAESKSWLFGFVDDLELEVRPNENVIAVRSASRVGRSDMGVNRRRVERLRRLLTDDGVLGLPGDAGSD